MKRLFAFSCLLLITMTTIFYLCFQMIGMHAEHLVGMVVGGYERFTNLYVKTQFLALSSDSTVQKLDKNSCAALKKVWDASQGFLAVVAIGDAQGNPICVADPSIPEPLPPMKDRLYYARVKNATDLIVGEFEISRTTGKQVVHYAYPIRSESTGELRGFLMAGVNLDWFADPAVSHYFHNDDVEILSIDSAGKLLYRYPSDRTSMGKEVLTPEQASVVLSGSANYKFMKGHDGKYRIFAFENRPIDVPVDGVFMVGVSITPFIPLIVLVGLLTLGSLMALWTTFIHETLPQAKKRTHR